jgi:hypothetical protein
MALGEILFPLCKFNYDLMYLVLQIAPAIAALLLVYNAYRLLNDNPESRANGRRGIRNALIGLILVVGFSSFGCWLPQLSACIPCPMAAYSPPPEPGSSTDIVNVWITSPQDGTVYTGNIPYTVSFTCQSSAGTVLVSYGDGTPLSGCGSHTYLSAGSYLVTATAQDGMRTATHRIGIAIKKSPTVGLVVTIRNPPPLQTEPTSVPQLRVFRPGEPVKFFAVASGGGQPYEYVWDFGDGSVPVNGQEVEHMYTAEGEYTFSVTVTDAGGYVVTQELRASVEPPKGT